jgi:peptidyl-prolyl cis-trans isomerase SurA
MKLRIALLISLVLVLFLPVVADTVVEEVIARVNNDIITRAEYQRSREQLMNEMKEKYGAEADAKFQDEQKNVLRDMIDQDLLVEKGKDLGITADTELIKKLDEMRKQMHLDSMDDLEKAAAEQGVSFEDFKQNMRNQIITQQVIGREVGSKMQITQEEEQAYYDAHKAELSQPEQVRLSEIMVSTTPKPAPAQQNGASGDQASAPAEMTPEQIAAAKAKADELLASIKGGANFAEVAKKSSDGPTASDGGDLGYFKRGTLAKELEDTTFNMKPGEVSNVIRTKQGFVILKVTEHQQAGLPPLKQIEPQIQDAIYYQKLQPALRAYLTKLREDAYIDIKPGYVDSAASPNETKPIYTAAVAQAPVVKKRKKKFLVF